MNIDLHTAIAILAQGFEGRNGLVSPSLSARQVARALNITPAAARGRLNRAREAGFVTLRDQSTRRPTGRFASGLWTATAETKAAFLALRPAEQESLWQALRMPTMQQRLASLDAALAAG